MSGVLAFAVALPFAVLFALSLFFFLEIAASLLPARRLDGAETCGAVAIVIPAHNESASMAPTLADAKRALRAGDRLLVVADNCDDDTAQVARAAGAEVLERRDAAHRGKGFALQYAIDRLKADPPEIIFFVDADCRISPDAVARASALAARLGRPAQAAYRMEAPPHAPESSTVAAFAWRVMNLARMRGLFRLAGTTRILGAGYALPWTLAREVSFAGGALVEDQLTTISLARMGHAPVMSAGEVTSAFPTSAKHEVTQRARWEHGSIGVAAKVAPRLLAEAIRKGDFVLLALALDAMVPPLALLSAVSLAAFLIALPLHLLGLSAPLALSGGALALLFTGLLLAWFRHGRDILPVKKWATLARFAVQKLRIYGSEGRASTRQWTRTGRDETP